MSLRFVPLTADLLGWCVLLSGSQMTRDLADSNPGFYGRLMAPPTIAEAMLDGGYLLGCGGITQHWPGRAEAWLMLAPDATRRQRAFGLRRCQQIMADAQADPGFRRIEMYLEAAAPWCATFAALMGMTREGTARAWDPFGRDHHLFARVKDA